MLIRHLSSRLILVGSFLAVATALFGRAAADCTSQYFTNPAVFGAEVVSINATVIENYATIPNNNICLVTVVITHPGTNDAVTNWISLPLSGWNSIFQGVGGGGFTAGNPLSLAVVSAKGYAAVTTDAGHAYATVAAAYDATPWALISPGNVNQYLLLNFARRSYHDMTVIGKMIVKEYYGVEAKYSYWNGCSTGGRQGLVMAQSYPADYDGILANAPAIQWNDFTPAQQWPYTVENVEGYAPAQCEFDAVNKAVIRACDPLDGLVDGIISAPAICDFNANSLVGQTYFCDTENTTRTFTQKTADVVNKIWQGPVTPSQQFLWYGLTKGTNFSSLAPTEANGTSIIPIPFGISDSWYRGFLLKDVAYTTTNITYATFSRLFLQGHIEYDSIMGSASPDLRAFRKRGGKMISWQGLADNFINPQGTILYYEKVWSIDPSVQDFYRQFYSAGVGHCGGGIGVIPTDPIGQLRAWVENGTAPATLKAASQYPINAASSYPVNGTNVRFQNLCPYPTVNKYNGKDNPALASSYDCIANSGWESFPGPDLLNNSCVGGPGWY